MCLLINLIVIKTLFYSKQIFKTKVVHDITSNNELGTVSQGFHNIKMDFINYNL